MNSLILFGSVIESKKQDHEIHAFGIDLGTTNSTVAEASWKPGEKPICQILEIDQPLWPAGTMTSPLVPSVVALTGEELVMIGEGAKRLRTRPQDANLFPERNLFYETKNDMGLRKTYHRAPDSYNHASKIAGHVLCFLRDAALQQRQGKSVHFCVTVPASFQINQRRDTLLACGYAGLSFRTTISSMSPRQHSIDYMMSEGTERVIEAGRTIQSVVFDFGGGTCDVSVLEITGEKKTKQILMSQIAVSRYHRLGGGDLDAAIVHEHLIPELVKENGLSLLDFTWAEKKRGLEPQLLGTAEALKEAICREIDRLKKFGKYEEIDKDMVMARQPGITLHLGNRSYQLARPSLTATQWEALLSPFLDRDLLYAIPTEFRLTQSIFAPLQDAMDRAGRKPEDIDFCLMVGGSSLIPQVQEAVENYFKKSSVGFFQDPLAIQLSVARGAAWNSLYKTITGKSLIRPILHESLALVTIGEASYPLVPAQTVLPYPAGGTWARAELVVPQQKELFVNRLLFKVVGAKEGETILHQIWEMPEHVSPGADIVLEYRITAGKQFQCRAFLKRGPGDLIRICCGKPACERGQSRQYSSLYRGEGRRIKKEGWWLGK